MKTSPKLTPIFVAFSVVLSALPQAALAQVVMRPVGAPAAFSGAAAASLAGGSVAAAPTTLAPLTTLSAAALPLDALAQAPAARLAAAAAPLQALAAAPALAAAALPSNAAPAAHAVQFPTPGAAATGIAAEAAAYAGEGASSAAAPASRKGLVGRLTDAVRGRASFSSLFDSSAPRGETPAPIFGRMSVKETKPVLLPNGTRPDEQPTTPSPDRERTVRLQTYSLPGANDVGGVLETNRKVLAADPNDVASVVNAIKGMVDADRARYGVSSSELRLIGARKFDGRGEQADSIFIHFRQVKDNLLVNGANLSFTLKVIDGRPMVVAQTGEIFPQIDVNLESTLTEEQVMGRIAERVGIPVADAASAFQFAEEKIIYARGSWRHAKLYVADGLPFMVAVDMATGLVFAWDNRTGILVLDDDGRLYQATRGPRTQERFRKNAGSGVGGTISGKAVDHGPIVPAAQLKDIPLSFLNLTIGGKTYTTDKDGKFSADGLEIAPAGLTLEATLSGPFVKIQDTTGKTLTINVTLKPGDGAVSAVFNPDSTLNDENAIAQVSAFHKVNLAYNFLRERKLTTEQMDKNAIVVRTNVDDECNAYYTPGSPSLNFFKSSANCVNSAYDTVADHEYGHYWDDSTGGIMNGGLSEGWGDTVSMYLLNNPVIGEHFLKHPGADGKDYIRHGENLYQYNEFDEVHAQGQAWQGFTWKLRKALIKDLGDAAGAALAEALVLPTMFAKAATIPDAIAQVLVNAMKKDGTIMYEDLIRATAKIHGIILPQNPGKGFIESLSRWSSALLGIGGQQKYFSQEKPSSVNNSALSTVRTQTTSPKPVAAETPTQPAIGGIPQEAIARYRALSAEEKKLITRWIRIPDFFAKHSPSESEFNIFQELNEISDKMADLQQQFPQIEYWSRGPLGRIELQLLNGYAPKTFTAASGSPYKTESVGILGALAGGMAAAFSIHTLAMLATVPAAVALVSRGLTKVYGPRAWIPSVSLLLGGIGASALTLLAAGFTSPPAFIAFTWALMVSGIFSAQALHRWIARTFNR